MLNVFLVDDEYYERLSLKNSIPWSELGMQISGEANNGETALEMMLENPPDIAVVDINMPKKNGLELIEQLTSRQIRCQYIILTGYDEFRYAQQAIRLNVSEYILKPINYPNLIASLTVLRRKIEEQKEFVTRMVSLSSENERLHLERYYNDLVNCNFSIQNMEQYDKKLAQELFITYDSYQVAVFESLEKVSLENLYKLQEKYSSIYDRTTFVVCLDNKRRLFFIMNGSCSASDPRLIEELIRLADQEGISCRAGIGNTCSQLEKIFLSYNEACIALQNCPVRNQSIVRYREIRTVPDICLDSKKKNILRAMIIAKETAKLSSFLTDLYTDLEQQQPAWDTITLYTLELISLLTECLSSQMAASISLLNSEGSILDTLNSKKDVPALRDWLIEIYTTSIRTVTEKEDYSDITRCVESYILEHYADSELSISAISKDLFLNYSYLCHCFKRDKQMTINDYISQLRISKSIELFQSGVENISFVAEKTGFSSASYFSKQFKKATGLSPTEYMKTLGKEADNSPQ